MAPMYIGYLSAFAELVFANFGAFCGGTGFYEWVELQCFIVRKILPHGSHAQHDSMTRTV